MLDAAIDRFKARYASLCEAPANLVAQGWSHWGRINADMPMFLESLDQAMALLDSHEG